MIAIVNACSAKWRDNIVRRQQGVEILKIALKFRTSSAVVKSLVSDCKLAIGLAFVSPLGGKQDNLLQLALDSSWSAESVVQVRLSLTVVAVRYVVSLFFLPSLNLPPLPRPGRCMQVLLEELEAFKRQLGKSDRKTRDMFDQIFSHQNARGETALGIALSNPQTDDNVVETLIALTSDFDVYETLSLWLFVAVERP